MWMSRILTLTSLLIAAPTWPQTHDHSGSTWGMDAAARAMPRGLAGLLKAGDESLRVMERAVERQDPRTVGELALQFMSVTESLGGYFDTDEPRSAKDITRVRKALERHVRVLVELAARASLAEVRQPLDAAHDTSLRTLEAVESSALAAAQAQSSDHHASSSGGRCGHR
jgi:hypothetical protein